MGITQRLGTIPLAISTDTSNNVGIGGSPSGSYKLEVTGTAKVSSTLLVSGAATFSSSVQSASLNIVGGTSASFSFAVDQQSTFAFGSTNGKRVGVIRDATAADNGLQFGYDTTDKTGIIAGAATSAGCGIDFYTYNGSAWGNRMRITSGGNVGIGTSSPTNITGYGGLTINGTNGAYTYWNINGTDTGRIITDSASMYFDNVSTGALVFRTTSGSTERMRITSGGGVTIPIGPLFVGITSGDATYVFQLPNNSSNKAKAYAWDTYSDIRIKKDVISINYGLNDILKLNPVSYKQYDSETIENKIILKDTYKQNIGFIAQETFDIIPEVVNKGKEEHELWGIDYSKIVPVLVKAVQEMNTKLDSQNQTIQNLQEQNKELNDRLTKAGL